jgi:hypothetical protein
MSRNIVRTATAVRMLVGLVTIALVTTGCRDQAQPAPGPVSSPTVASVSEPVAFHVQLGAGQTLTMRSSQLANCPGLDALIDLGPDGGAELVAYATSCAPGDNARPGNGRHGVYRTTADIPADRRSGAVTVHTALGEATAFDQQYYECTNSCKTYTEPVAVITLTHPTNPAFQTLTAFSAKGSIGLDRLSALLRDQLLA